jgi:hypothetical protein
MTEKSLNGREMFLGFFVIKENNEQGLTIFDF